MEDTGLLNIENPIDMLALHITFLPRINSVLSEFMETFNHHGLRTESNWSPYQLWFNGMLNPDNSMASSLLDDEVDPELHEFYGLNREAPIPLEESSNNVVIPPIILPRDETDSVYAQVSQVMDSLMPSTQLGIDIYCMVRQLIKDILENQQ